MSADNAQTLTLRLVEALRSAYTARRSPPDALEDVVRAYARAKRVQGEDIAHVLIEVKRLVREHTAEDEPIYTPKVVGWTVAGFFYGMRTHE